MYIDTTNNTMTIRCNKRNDDTDWGKVRLLADNLVAEHEDLSITRQCHFDRIITLRSSGVSMTLRGLECRFTKALTYIND
jgi:hypothetical protein